MSLRMMIEKSCLPNPIELFPDITGRIDKGEPKQVEFDKILHKRLVNKHRAHRIWKGGRGKTVIKCQCRSENRKPRFMIHP